MGGEVVVNGDVSEARIQCRSLKVGGSLSQSEIICDHEVEVEGDAFDVQIQVGTWRQEHARLRRLVVEISRLEEDVEAFNVRLRMKGRRFLRDYGSIDVSFGNIVTKSGRRMEVNLDPIYRILQKFQVRTEEEVDQGLQEFFTKVIVASLTRANRYYIQQNLSRRLIFLRLVIALREYVQEVREGDKLFSRLMGMRDQRKRQFRTLQGPTPWGVGVRGEIRPSARVQILQLIKPKLDDKKELEADLDALASTKPAQEQRVEEVDRYQLQQVGAHLEVVAAESGDLCIHLVSTQGVPSQIDNSPQKDLTSVRICLEDDIPAWKHL